MIMIKIFPEVFGEDVSFGDGDEGTPAFSHTVSRGFPHSALLPENNQIIVYYICINEMVKFIEYNIYNTIYVYQPINETTEVYHLIFIY